MKYDFETRVSRDGLDTLKAVLMPESLKSRNAINFFGAEFEFKTAPSIIDAVVRRAQNGLFGYTVCTSEYLNRVQWWMKECRGFTVEPEWIVPTHGTIFSVATAIRLLTSTDGGIITLNPEYGRYKQAATRLGRKTEVCELVMRNGRYEIDFERLGAAMAAARYKLFVFSNPANPTGRVWSYNELREIAVLAAKHNITVFSDEIFAEVVFEGRRATPFIEAAEGTGASCIIATSLGKAFSFTGVNHANIIINDSELRENFITQRNADHYGSIDPVLHAALFGAYSEDGLGWLREMVEYIWANYLFIEDFLRREIPGIKPVKPEGAYVLWLDCAGLELGDTLGDFLLNKAGFCADGGEDYGASDNFIRINIAAPRSDIKAALEGLRDALPF